MCYEEGVVRTYYESGEVRMEYTFKDGKQVGKAKYRNKKGEQTEKDTWSIEKALKEELGQ